MAAPASPSAVSGRSAIPALLLNTCFVLAVINVAFFPGAYLAHFWIFDGKGLGIPTDFVNVWSAGKLALDGHPALAWNWDIQKQVQVAVLGQSYPGNFAWHYPPPFLFVALLLAHFPYGAAFAGWALASLVPYLAMMRALTGKAFGLLLGLAFPVVLTNTLVGQNGFLTASLIGASLFGILGGKTFRDHDRGLQRQPDRALQTHGVMTDEPPDRRRQDKESKQQRGQAVEDCAPRER